MTSWVEIYLTHGSKKLHQNLLCCVCMFVLSVWVLRVTPSENRFYNALGTSKMICSETVNPLKRFSGTSMSSMFMLILLRQPPVGSVPLKHVKASTHKKSGPYNVTAMLVSGRVYIKLNLSLTPKLDETSSPGWPALPRCFKLVTISLSIDHWWFREPFLIETSTYRLSYRLLQ